MTNRSIRTCCNNFKPREELIEKVVCFLLLLVVVCSLSWYFKEIWRLTLGDSSIAWVYAKNLAEHGQVLEYNLGEKSTGCTSLGHILLLASVHKLVGPGPEYLYYDLAVFVLYVLSLVVLFSLCMAWGTGPVAALFAVGTYVVFVPQTYYSAVSFETPVWLFFVFLMWLCSVPFTKRPWHEISWKTKAAFAVVAAVQTSYRPEAIVFTGICLSYLLWYNRKALNKNSLWQWFLMCFVSVFPFLYLTAINYIYFGSLAGTSSTARLKLMQFLGSERGFGFFAISIWQSHKYHWLLLVVPAFAVFKAIVHYALRHRKRSQCSLPADRTVIRSLPYSVLPCMFFFLIFSLKYRIDIGDRYAVPFLACLCVISGLCAHFLYSQLKGHLFLKFLCLCIGLFGCYQFVGEFIIEDSKGKKKAIPTVPPSAMFEEDLVAWLHDNTNEDDYVLVYEVQMKYLLDRRILDFDGILSGKSLPYFRTNLWHEFLQKCRPNIWVANPAVFYRKDMFLPGSLFHRVIQTFDENGGIGQSREFSGIKFTLIKKRQKDSQSDYSEYTHVFRISYPKQLATQVKRS